MRQQQQQQPKILKKHVRLGIFPRKGLFHLSCNSITMDPTHNQRKHSVTQIGGRARGRSTQGTGLPDTHRGKGLFLKGSSFEPFTMRASVSEEEEAMPTWSFLSIRLTRVSFTAFITNLILNYFCLGEATHKEKALTSLREGKHICYSRKV